MVATAAPMSVDVSLVLVTYRSAPFAALAATKFREQVARFGASGEVVLVDHSEDREEAARLGAIGAERLLLRPNRGYAAGVNAGVAACVGRRVLVGNPDVAFRDGAVGALLDALGRGWDIVGPQFVLGGFLFPPADLKTPGEVIVRWLASRSGWAWRGLLRREVGRSLPIWRASQPVAVPMLSGALLAFSPKVAERTGLWDERYFLYFEETDWLRRAVAAGMRVAQVPGAQVEHVWGQAADPGSCAEYYLASQARFFAQHFGWRGRFVTRLRIGPQRHHLAALPSDPAELLPGELLWLLSPSALGLPAAGLVGTAADALASLRAVARARAKSSRYVVHAVEPRTGSIRGAWSWETHDG